MITIIKHFLFFNVTLSALSGGALSLSVERLDAIEQGITEKALMNDRSLVHLSASVLLSKVGEQRLLSSMEKVTGYQSLSNSSRLLYHEAEVTR